MARLSAMARALKASGAADGIDYLRAHVFLSLLMGTLPLIPRSAGAPPTATPARRRPLPGRTRRRRCCPTATTMTSATAATRWTITTPTGAPSPRCRNSRPCPAPPPMAARAAPAGAPRPVPAPGHADLPVSRPGHDRPDRPRHRHLARLAATRRATQCRVILTDDHDHAIAAGRGPRSHPPGDLTQTGAAGLAGRVTITMPVTTLDRDLPASTQTGEILHEILAAAAARARAKTAQLADTDLTAPGGCAHAEETAAASHHPGPASTSPPATSPAATPTAGSPPAAPTSTTPAPGTRAAAPAAATSAEWIGMASLEGCGPWSVELLRPRSSPVCQLP
jgi:hypothetical protein